MQEQRVDETRQKKQEEFKDLDKILECFQRNYVGSVCSNTAERKFVSFEQTSLRSGSRRKFASEASRVAAERKRRSLKTFL